MTDSGSPAETSAGAVQHARPPMRIDLLSIFPGLFEPVLSQSITGRARDAGLVDWRTWDIRHYADNKHAKVDDRPFGGGPGMVMMCQPIWAAVHDAEVSDDRPATRLFLSPEGEPLTQGIVEALAAKPRLLILCGRYEGVDERVIERLSLRRLSVGDFVVSGGEIPAMLLIDAVVRLLPGALGHERSAAEDSFAAEGIEDAAAGSGAYRTGAGTPRLAAAGKIGETAGARLLDCPHYTRPREWLGMEAPEVLFSGDHKRVRAWRRDERLARTRRFRPDLLEG